jgi:hypothetical protein
MEKQIYAICAQHSCKFSQPYNAADIKFMLGVDTFDNKNKTIEELDEINHGLPEKNRFCQLCGSDLLFYCPHCKKGFFDIPDPCFCGVCGKEIKPKDYSEGAF